MWMQGDAAWWVLQVQSPEAKLLWAARGTVRRGHAVQYSHGEPASFTGARGVAPSP